MDAVQSGDTISLATNRQIRTWSNGNVSQNLRLIGRSGPDPSGGQSFNRATIALGDRFSAGSGRFGKRVPDCRDRLRASRPRMGGTAVPATVVFSESSSLADSVGHQPVLTFLLLGCRAIASQDCEHLLYHRRQISELLLDVVFV